MRMRNDLQTKKYLSLSSLFEMKYSVFAICIIAVLISGCHDEKKDVEEEIIRMQSHPIVLPLQKMACRYKDRDTIATDNINKQLRMVVYVDSSRCSPCTLDKMFVWNDFIKETDSVFGGRLECVFIVAPKPEQMEDAFLSIESSGLKKPVYVDTTYAFRKANKDFPNDSRFHTFLLDRNDSILLVGNPLEMQIVKELLYKNFSNNNN